jgi:hypothetical protein
MSDISKGLANTLSPPEKYRKTAVGVKRNHRSGENPLGKYNTV